MEEKKRKQIFWFWSIVLIVLAGGVVWFYRSSLTAGSIKYAVAETGTITHERKVMATFANLETLVLAPISGKIQYVGEDGQRFRRGEAVATIQADGAAPGTKRENAQNQMIQAVTSGLFFRQNDGLELILTSENLTTMDLEKLLAQTGNVKNSAATVQIGEVVGKIVNNLIPTKAFLELPSADQLEVGKTLRITTGNQTVNAKILRKSDQPKGAIVQFPHYVDGSVADRHHEVTWIYRPAVTGVLVPKSALWTKGEELGVFLASEGVVQFKKIKVLDQDENQICIENIPSGIPVVITPRDGLEGLVANVKNI
ncbi:HlyD family efflux transporter periplasmic adaptor subunit [Desulfosporosinus sp. BICA1-9]|uniref:HlyD family efflux transporter periplasmic adaptor subunit n=1 Tax=Desulfosporosinus sp. BICA1-9 TaxID=1531958 RepID=UPI00054B7BA0|nr:HlyD family efflux transporter periplasmic adaptor subunit [Desulfosporosinus sp. BICA1-9]KJS50867.1 MAG: hypothetical protein VR66_00465 [Peptococcaceae bacterium BRH_c23]KJS79410.1 MAG: hypothetical protein JL57_30030 [Desulfosporosinus sp. BICA1-9]HBW34250.1 hypothetical protein [Desulfosporosinus sp.]